MTAARTAGVCLVLAGIALAEPAFRIGTKLTYHGVESYSEWPDSTGTPVAREVYDRFFVGPTVEASYGPVWGFLTGRLDLAQVDIFTSGGAAFRLFPTLGLDLLAEPPIRWRVKPYVWVGVRTTAYGQSPSSSVAEFYRDAETHWRGGLGAKYKLSNRIELLAETQLYARDNWWEGVDYSLNEAQGTDESGIEIIGPINAELGARFALGK